MKTKTTAIIPLIFVVALISTAAWAALTQTQLSQNMVQEFYIGYYGRPADPAGLLYWEDRFDMSDDLNDVLNQFGTSTEFTTNFEQ